MSVNKNPFFFLIGIVALFSSCHKSDIPGSDVASLTREAKIAFQNNFTASIKKPESSDTRNPRKDLYKFPDWEKAQEIDLAGKKALFIPVTYAKEFSIFSNFSGNKAYNVNNITKMVVYKKKDGEFAFEVVTYLPDKDYQPNKFSGIFMVETWEGNLINRYRADKTGSIRKYDFDKEKSSQKESGNEIGRNTAIVTVCYEYSGYNCSPSTGECYNWSYSAGCDSYFLDDGFGDDFPSDEYLDLIDNSGTGGGGGSGFPAENVITVEDGPSPIANVNDYNKCFTNSPGNGNQYKVTLCVEQPIPGTRESWGWNGSNASGSINPVMVGHTFLVLTQTSPSGTITRNIGYYPSGGVSNFSPTSGGELNNDANSPYDIAIEVSLNSSQFFSILDFISQTNSPGFIYNLNTNNCTHFALNALGSVGINFPRTYGSWTNGGGLNPGDLGEDMRSMQLSSNMTRLTVNNSHPNRGSCY